MLTDAAVGAGDTLAAMEATVSALSPATVHAELLPLRARINQGLDLGGNEGSFSTANIQAASTLVGLAANTATDITRLAGGPVVE